MQTLKKRPPRRSSLTKRSGFWGRNLRKFHPKPSQSDLGRFISADPIGFQGGLNQYIYGNQNPVNAVDPSGLNPIVWYLLGEASVYAPAVTAALLPVLSSPLTLQLMEGLLSPPGYIPSPVAFGEAEVANAARQAFAKMEPSFPEYFRKGTSLFRAVETSPCPKEMADIMRRGRFRQVDPEMMKNFFANRSQATQLGASLEQYGIKMTIVEGKLAYSALGGSRFLPYKVTGEMKVLVPGAQLPNITPILP